MSPNVCTCDLEGCSRPVPTDANKHPTFTLELGPHQQLSFCSTGHRLAALFTAGWLRAPRSHTLRTVP